MKKLSVGVLTCLMSYLVCFLACSQKLDEGDGKHRASKPLPFSQVRLEGELRARYMAATCNLLTHTDRYSLDSFAASAAGRPGALWWDWPGDQIGRWLSVLHVAEGYGWTPAVWHRRAVADVILPLQAKDGRFGPPEAEASKDVRLLSGNAFALRGLMDAYADTRDIRFLDAARKLARYFETIAPAWETRREGKLHEFFGHCIDGLVALYELGGDRWALDFAERIAPNAGRTSHVHHSLSLFRGLVELARVTGKCEYIEKVEDYLAWCSENRTATGGLPEAMPESYEDEGCGLADWIVINLMMFEAIGEERYMDDAEHTLVNHFFMNQFHTGGFGHLLFSQEIVGGKGWQGWDEQYGSENPGCCSLWGQWALGQSGQYIMTQSNDTVFVNLYPSATIMLPDGDVCLKMTSDFPRMNKIRISVICQKPESFTLALRVPPWAEDMQVQIDGSVVEKQGSGRRMCLTHKWKNTVMIDIAFVTGLQAVPWPADKPRGVALFDGPLCLGLSSETADVDLPWSLLVDASGRPRLDDKGRPQVVEPSGRIVNALKPVSAFWLLNEVEDPVRRRILF